MVFAQNPEFLHLHLDVVARVEQPGWGAGVTDARRSARGQQITGPQCECAGYVRQRLSDRIDHLVGRGVLHGCAVDAGADAQTVAEVPHVVGRHEGPEWSRAVRVLPEDPL